MSGTVVWPVKEYLVTGVQHLYRAFALIVQQCTQDAAKFCWQSQQN